MSLPLKSSRLVRCSIAIALVIASPRGLQGNNDTWKTAGTSGNWNDNTKWTDGSFPIGTDSATFGVTGTYTVTFVAAPTAIEDLTVSAGTVTMQSSGGPFTLGVTSASGGNNAITVTGASTILTLGTGTGQLSLTAGGNLSVNLGATLNDKFGSDLVAATLNLGTAVGSGNGTLLVDGSGSTLTVSGQSNLGQNGNTGTLTFQNSSTGSLAAISLAPSGVANSSGSLSVLSGSDLTSSGNLNIGINALAGQTGTFTLDGAGSSFTQTGASTTITLGAASNSIGTINVGVANSGGTFATGFGLFTINPTGTLNIGSGGNTGIFTANGDVTINGGVLNRGSGSTFTMNGLTMTIQNGGSANFTNGYTTTGATYNVTGAGSTLQTLSGTLSINNGGSVQVSNGGLLAGLTNVGTAGSGFLDVDGNTGGASVTSGGTANFAANGASATVILHRHATGSFSTINIANSTTADSVGHFEVDTGADLSLGSLNIATLAGTGNSGFLLLDGTLSPVGDTSATQSAGSSVTIGNGSTGSGSLAVTNGASFTASSGTTAINGTGQLSILTGASYTTSGIVNVNTGGSGTAALIDVNGAGSTFTQSGAVALTVGHATTGAAALKIGVTANGGTFNTGTGTIQVLKTGTVTVGSGANNGTFNVNGNLTISGGEVDINTAGSVFALAAGRTLTINSSGTLNFAAGGYTTNGSTHTITGAGSTLSTMVTFVHNGSTLNVQAGGTLSAQRGIGIGDNGTNGTVTVNGSTSQLISDSSFGSVIGSGGSTGSLTLSTGAQATLGNVGLATGSSPNTVGNVTVQGGAHFTMDGLSLTAGNGSTGSSSTFTVTGAGSTATVGIFGTQVGANTSPGPVNATLTVTSSGAFTSSFSTTNILTRGLLNIDGGTFTADGSININGGTLQQQSTLGSVFSWTAGHTLTIQGGGDFVTFGGFTAPASAIVNVNGAGSTMALNDTAMLISGGAQLKLTTGGSASASFFVIGDTNSGTVSVDGTGSTLMQTTTNSANTLGTNGGSGSLALHNNGSATLLAPLAIAASTTTGTTGTLIVDSGAHFSCTNLLVGNFGAATTSSLVTVAGPGSTVTLSGSLTLGNSSSGPATVNVNDGGVLTVGPGKSTTLNPSGTINLSGGIADLQNLVLGGGAINFNSGSIAFIGNLTVGAGGILGSNLTLDATKSVTLSGTTTIDPVHILTLSGGSLTTDSLVNNGTLDFSGGTLRITGAGGLTIGSGGPLGSTFELGTGRTLIVTNTTTISNNALLSIDPGSTFTSGLLANSSGGELYLSGPTAVVGGATMTNAGLIRGEGRITANVTNTAGGEIRAESGQRIKLSGANGASAGKINLQGGTAEFTQPLTNAGTGLITGRGTLITGGTGLNNLGSVALSSGITDVFGDVVNNTGSGSKGVTISGSAAVTFWDDVTNTSGLFKVSAGSSATFFGIFGGGGISGAGQVNFEADVTPGFSPAAVTFGGNLTFDSTSTLHIDIGGTTPGSGPNNHDQVNIAGTAALAGTLDLVPFNGFVPVAGDKFVVMTYASATGTFSTVTGTNPAPGLTYTPVYSPTNLTIITTNSGEKTWDIDASGNSSVGANWTGGIAPGGIGDSAAFTTVITANRIVSIDTATTVGTLRFDDDNNYSLQGSSTLTLQNTGSAVAVIAVQNAHGDGAHSISAPITLASDLNIVQNSSGTFTLAGPIDNSSAQAITKSGSGTVEIAVAPTLGDGTAVNVNAGTLRFAATGGTPTIGTGVSVAVNGSATLELAGSASALAAGVNRANVANNSASAAGVLASGLNQVVGNIDGNGTTQVSAGSDLTANHIIQGALVIGGTDGNPGLVTIAASDALGNPLSEVIRLPAAGAAQASESFGFGAVNVSVASASSDLDAMNGSSGAMYSIANGGGGNASPVPEPSALLLALLAATGFSFAARLGRRRR